MKLTINKNKMNPNEWDSSNKEDSAYETNLASECHSATQDTIIKHGRIHTMKEIKEMNKKELVELVNAQQEQINDMNAIQQTQEALIAELKLKLEATSKDGRKSQVLDLLRKNKTISILEISKALSISTKNVSSQLTYLRQDGYAVFTDPNGRKTLIEDQETNDTQQTE